MKGSVFPGDTMVLTGTVEGTEVDEAGCGWVAVAIELAVDGDVKTTCSARVAVPGRPTTTPGLAGVTSGDLNRR